MHENKLRIISFFNFLANLAPDLLKRVTQWKKKLEWTFSVKR